MAFDLLRLGAKDYRADPLKVRRRALEDLLKGQTLILPARRLSPNGFAAWTEVLRRGWEGMVAKDPAAHYVGGWTRERLKVNPEVSRGRMRVLQAVARSRKRRYLSLTGCYGRARQSRPKGAAL